MEEGRTGTNQPFPAFVEPRIGDPEPKSEIGTPRLASNALSAGFQVFWWLFVRPSAWRACLAGSTPPVSADFVFGDLHRDAFAERGPGRLLIAAGVAWCILSLAINTLISISFGIPIREILVPVLYGFILSLAGTAITSSLISAAAGLSGGLVVGTVFTVAAASALKQAGSIAALESVFNHASFLRIILGGVPGLATTSAGIGAAISIGIGITGALTERPAENAARNSLAKRFGGIVIGVGICAMIDAVVLQILFVAERRASLTILQTTLGLLVAVMIFFAALIHSRSLPRSAAIACCFGAIAICSAFLVSEGVHESAMILAFAGVVTALLYSALFALAFSAGNLMADPWAGAVASALGSGLPFVMFLVFGAHAAPAWPSIPISFLCICLGLLLPRTMYVFVFPIEMAWNLIVLKADQRDRLKTKLLLNAAFWDENQRFKLRGLEDHLLLALERAPRTAERALAWLAKGPQAWAVRAVRIELCARLLDDCVSLEEIAAAHRRLPALEWRNAADPIQWFYDISRSLRGALRFENQYQRHMMLRALRTQVNDRMMQGFPGRNRARLLPILARWNETISQAVALLEISELSRNEVENPYVVGVPLTAEQEVFVGRSDISAQIAQSLLGPHAHPLLLYGQRRMGKTSLLNCLGHFLPNHVVPLFVDLQGPASYANDSAGFLLTMSRAMVDSAHRYRGFRLPLLEPASLEKNPFDGFDRWLGTIEETFDDRILVLALDELESFEMSLQNQRFDGTAVLALLRYTIQHRRRFRILAAASHAPDEFDRVASHLVNLQMLKIDYLTQTEARQLIEHPLRDFALRYDPDAVMHILDLTRGHPHLLQSICYEIVNLKNEQPDEHRFHVHVGDVEQAASFVLKHGALFFEDISRNQLSPEARALAVEIARGTEGRASQPNEALDLLCRREIMEPFGSGYKFQVELIRRWFACTPIQ